MVQYIMINYMANWCKLTYVIVYIVELNYVLNRLYEAQTFNENMLLKLGV